MRMLLQKRLTIAMLLAALGTAISGCATTQPVNTPCGVVTDSLQDVHATTSSGDLRISKHFERGVAAGCWPRVRNPTS